MKTRLVIGSIVMLLGGCQVLTRAEDRPHGYRYVDLQKRYERTYGGYWWTTADGDICEEGIAVQGSPLVCSSDTMVVIDAATAQTGDLHFVDRDIRRTWIAGRSTGLHLFSKSCPDSLVGSWGSYVPVLFRYRPGVMVQDVRRPGYTETFGVTHHVGTLTYNTLRAKQSPLEVRQSWYIPYKWCVVDQVEVRNLTDEKDNDASVAIAVNLGPHVSTNRGQLDWYADFHSKGKAGVPVVPRLTDQEYRKLLKLAEFEVEYRETEGCIVAQTGWDVRAPSPTYYYVCLMLDGSVERHVIASEGGAEQSSLFAEGKDYPRRLTTKSGVIGLRSRKFRLGAKGTHTMKYAIAFGKTTEEAISNAKKGLGVSIDEATRKLDKYWAERLPAFITGAPTLNSILKYAAITCDINWEPDGRASGDLGGWGRAERAELCGYKNYYDQDDMVVPILDVPVYDPELAEKALLYDINPQTGRLKKLIVWRQQYDNMLLWPSGVYKVWMATGDDEFLKKMYPVLDNTMRWLHKTRTEPDGLLRMLTMPYDKFTIGLGDDRTVTIRAQAIACDALRLICEMARHLNKPEDITFYEKWRAQVKKEANERLWQGTFYGMCLDFPEHFNVSGNSCAILAGLCDKKQARSICREIGKLYTGTGFPELHPPVPAWVGSAPYTYQNGDMYVDQLALIARAANEAGDTKLLRLTFFEFNRIVQRWKCFPVTIHPWNADSCTGVNEIHSASALIACLIYGVAGVEEEKILRFRPMLIPEMGGRVEVRDYLFRGTKFDFRLEGEGTKVQSTEIDGKAIAEPVVPAEYYDGKKHTVVIRVQGT